MQWWGLKRLWRERGPIVEAWQRRTSRLGFRARRPVRSLTEPRNLLQVKWSGSAMEKWSESTTECYFRHSSWSGTHLKRWREWMGCLEPAEKYAFDFELFWRRAWESWCQRLRRRLKGVPGDQHAKRVLCLGNELRKAAGQKTGRAETVLLDCERMIMDVTDLEPEENGDSDGGEAPTKTWW